MEGVVFFSPLGYFSIRNILNFIKRHYIQWSNTNIILPSLAPLDSRQLAPYT